jgi:hypothetical protein
MSYVTDGTELYEVVAEEIVQNFGLRRGQLRTTFIRRCRAPYEVRALDDLAFACFEFVRP